MSLDDAQIRSIAEAIAREISPGGGPPARSPAAGPMCGPPPAPSARAARSAPPAAGLGHGVFTSIDEAIKAARQAFFDFGGIGLEKRKAIIDALRQTLRGQVEDLSRRAIEETGLGRYEDKVQKNKLVTERTPGPEDLEPIAMTGDSGLTLLEPAPFGVIGAITPVTNPTSTIICNVIGMLSAGNTVVFNVHPSAKRVSVHTVQLLNRAIQGAGGPANTVTCTAEPTIESAQTLMTHPLTRIVVVTGGPGVVKAAMNSGKRAICAGPGNPPAVVDATADIEKAGRLIVYGHSFDNNVICVDEKECIVVDAVADDLKAAMCRHGAYQLDPRDLPRLEKVIFSEMAGPRGHAHVNRELVGKSAHVILKELGVTVGPEVRAVMIEVPNDHPLVWTEQMMPVLPVTRVRSVDEAIDLAIAAEGGNFHTATMHSHDLRALDRMARLCNCSIFVKNGTGVAGLGHGGQGYTSFTIASPTGEGLTRPRSFSRWRRCSVVDHFRIV